VRRALVVLTLALTACEPFPDQVRTCRGLMAHARSAFDTLAALNTDVSLGQFPYRCSDALYDANVAEEREKAAGGAR
jgi:hypothetical protein